MARVTPAQRRALVLLLDGAMPETARTIRGVQRRVLDTLLEAGLVRFQPYAEPEPVWRITAAGRKEAE